jgi:predicted NBD/HSP70 family sugar kinase
MDGVIVQGSQGFAGQMGHNSMVDQGPLCKCGKRGCLEALCGIGALLQKTMAELPFIERSDALRQRYDSTGELNINDIVEIAGQEDSYARGMLRQTARYVGSATASIMNFCNPDAVFIGGKLAVNKDFFIEEFRTTVRNQAFPEVGANTPVYISSLGADAGVIGACALVLERLLNSPDVGLLEYIAELTQQKRKKTL